MTLKMGKHSYVAGEDFKLWLHNDGIIDIGKYCSIAQNVAVITGTNHGRGWVTTFPFDSEERDIYPRADVTIGNDVWIGVGAIIIGPVNIGDGSIVSGGAVVVNDVAPYEVVGGVPARRIKWRFEDSRISELLKIKWWDWQPEKIKRATPFLLSSNVDAFLDWAKREVMT